MGSDEVLKFEGYMRLLRKIRERSGNCKISILGGSHSAFSVVYLLLNGPIKIKGFEDIKGGNSLQVNNRGQSQTPYNEGKG